MKISASTARQLAVQAQGLGGEWRLPRGKGSIARVVERLGYVQIDTIAVVRRAHHHTIWSRCPGYREEALHELQATDRRVFEYWGHCASYLPMRDYRFYLPQMDAHRTPTKTWPKRWLARHGHLMDPILQRFRDDGPMSGRELEPSAGRKADGFSPGSPMQIALGLLVSCGDVMVSHRRGFEKIYDLRERVVPTGTDMRMPSRSEQGRFFVERALSAYGLATRQEINGHLHRCDKKAIADALAALVDSGEVLEGSVEDVEGGPYYALADTLETADSHRNSDPCVHILSPFDNLIAQRRRTQELFGFHFLLESYKPKHKREYGYFCLPILWGQRFVGRMDAKADRAASTLVIKHLMFEPTFSAFDAVAAPLADKLAAFAGFNACERVTIEACTPAKAGDPVEREIQRVM